MVEIIRERNPQFMDELRRDFKPYEVVEGDFSYRLVAPDGQSRIVHRRQRKVRYVSADQNELRETTDDLGPGTGEDAYVIPCDGAVEMAQAVELIDWAKRKAAEEVVRRAEVEPLRTASWWDWLRREQEKATLQIRGASTFGPHQRTQREGVSK